MGRAFRCPICGAGFYRSVYAPRPDGTHRQTFLHECTGCSTVFLDPIAFNANEPGPPHSRGPTLPKRSPETPDLSTNSDTANRDG